MTKIGMKVRNSNWETVAFVIIYDFLRTKGKYFSRSELMKTRNIDKAVKWLEHLNHKKYPTHPEETFQRTIQNLRDKGYIIFHGQGEYELTNEGIEECRRVVNELNVQVSNMNDIVEMIRVDSMAEDIEKIKEILKGMSPDEISELLKRSRQQNSQS